MMKYTKNSLVIQFRLVNFTILKSSTPLFEQKWHLLSSMYTYISLAICSQEDNVAATYSNQFKVEHNRFWILIILHLNLIHEAAWASYVGSINIYLVKTIFSWAMGGTVFISKRVGVDWDFSHGMSMTLRCFGSIQWNRSMK